MKKIAFVAILFVIVGVIFANNFNWRKTEKVKKATDSVISDATAFVYELTDLACSSKQTDFTAKAQTANKNLERRYFEIMRRAKISNVSQWQVKKINNNDEFMVVFAENAICRIQLNKDNQTWNLQQVSIL